MNLPEIKLYLVDIGEYKDLIVLAEDEDEAIDYVKGEVIGIDEKKIHPIEDPLKLKYLQDIGELSKVLGYLDKGVFELWEIK